MINMRVLARAFICVLLDETILNCCITCMDLQKIINNKIHRSAQKKENTKSVKLVDQLFFLTRKSLLIDIIYSEYFGNKCIVLLARA